MANIAFETFEARGVKMRMKRGKKVKVCVHKIQVIFRSRESPGTLPALFIGPFEWV